MRPRRAGPAAPARPETEAADQRLELVLAAVGDLAGAGNIEALEGALDTVERLTAELRGGLDDSDGARGRLASLQHQFRQAGTALGKAQLLLTRQLGQLQGEIVRRHRYGALLPAASLDRRG
jgi:hypothetical protein